MTQAFVCITVKSGAPPPDNILEQLRKIKGVKEAQAVHGPYDFVVKIETKSNEGLKRLIVFGLPRKIPALSSTCTMMVIDGP